jgi:hypothetical protein
MDGLERCLRHPSAAELFPGRRLSYNTPGWIYAGAHMPFDPRHYSLKLRSSTIKVYGVYLGVDKIGHFHDLGHIYFKEFQKLRRGAKSEEQARRTVVHRFTRGLISEAAIIGTMATGVHSHADLAANYLGFKFYRNLTEPVVVRDRLHPPLLTRVGAHWRTNMHAHPEADILRPFISDHMNEALNPSLLEWSMRASLAARLAANALDILAFYADERGVTRPREYFESRMRELSTIDGEDYGHRVFLDDQMVTIANSCFSQ